MLYCLILGASYSSSLKSYMTTPLMVESLDSIKDIVNGPLPWKYTRYYGIEENVLASMTDEVHKKLWNNKISLYEYNSPVSDIVCCK